MPPWEHRLRSFVRQSPLVETRPSLCSLERSSFPVRPKVVFTGIGLCTPDRLSVGLPLDVLGLLLPAEALRRALGSQWLLVLIADVHALGNGFDPALVEERAQETERVLQRVRDAFRLPRLRIQRASSFQGRPAYLRLHERVRRQAEGLQDYVTREMADVEFLHRQWGGLLKVGWTVSRDCRSSHQADEMLFDEEFRRWFGDHVGFVYAKAGRALDDRRPKACPYIATDPDRRILLHPREDVSAKLREAASQVEISTIRGVKRHLAAVTRAHREVVGPVSGPVELRIQRIIRAVASGGRHCSSA